MEAKADHTAKRIGYRFFQAEEQEGALALIDVDSVHILQPHEVGAECASDCAKGYFAWQLSNILPIKNHVEASAKRKIY